MDEVANYLTISFKYSLQSEVNSLYNPTCTSFDNCPLCQEFLISYAKSFYIKLKECGLPGPEISIKTAILESIQQCMCFYFHKELKDRMEKAIEEVAILYV